MSIEKAKNDFLKARKTLMQQIFFEHEYKKRHFIINNDASLFDDIVSILFALINSNEDDTPRLILEEHIACFRRFSQSPVDDNDKLKISINTFLERNRDFPNAFFRNYFTLESTIDIKKCYIKILENEYIARRDYNIPFYVLMVPLDMRDIISKFMEGKDEFYPFPPIYNQIQLSSENMFFRTVFAYPNNEDRKVNFEDDEKEYLKLIFNSFLDGKSTNIPLLCAIIKISNGAELSEQDFITLTKKIDSIKTSDMRRTSQQKRLYGILFYDFLLAVGKDIKNDDFIRIFHQSLGLKEKKYYSKSTKDRHIENRSLTSKCINLGRIVPTANTGTTDLPKHKVILPEFQFYKDYQNLYLELKARASN